MHKSIVLVMMTAGVLGGCAVVGPLPNRSAVDPSDPAAPEASERKFPPNLVATTHTYLDPSAGKGAQSMGGMKSGMGDMGGMDHSKMQGMDMKQPPANGAGGMDHSKMQGMGQPAAGSPQPGGMQGMDHSKMPGMENKQPAAAPSAPPGGMKGMDNAKMPGMGSQPSAAVPNKEQLEQEMKKTSDEMKVLSDGLKRKSDAAEKAGKDQAKDLGASATPTPNVTPEKYQH